MAAGVYKITHVPSGRVYVGSAVNIELRWREHKTDLKFNRHGNQHLQKSCNKHGSGEFSFEIVEICEFDEDTPKNVQHDTLVNCEQYWIDTLQACSRDKGFNILPKAYSHLGAKRPPETGAKISDALKAKGVKPPGMKGFKHSEESRAKMSASMKGRVVWNKGKGGYRGKPHSPEAIEKTRQGNLGKKRSPETLERMRNAVLGTHHPGAFIYTLTSPSGEIFTTDNLTEFYKSHGINYSSALAVVHGRYKTIHGWAITKGKR